MDVKEKWCSMLSFEITAIDLILVIAVIVLLLLYVVKLANSPEEFIKKSLEDREKSRSRERVELKLNTTYNECPRGFGKIKGIDYGDSISDRCLTCYRISECYSEEKKIKS